jgi:RNA polymerase sigma-70 factor (ECF subfamily)
MHRDLHTPDLRHLIGLFKQGDPTAADELFRRAANRLERLARTMLRNFPRVQQREETGDVVQEAMISLLTALRELSFSSTREFYGLAAEHIRRRLLDLNRRHSQPHRDHQPLAHNADQVDPIPAADADEELHRWHLLHEAVAALPADQREVFSLRLYHGWNLDEIASLLQISTKTVSRLWLRAQMRLTEQLNGCPLPGEEE